MVLLLFFLLIIPYLEEFAKIAIINKNITTFEVLIYKICAVNLLFQMKQIHFSICLLIVLIFFSCMENKSIGKDTEKSPETVAIIPELSETESTPEVGDAVYGDFDGNGTFEYALVKLMETEDFIAYQDTQRTGSQ